MIKGPDCCHQASSINHSLIAFLGRALLPVAASFAETGIVAGTVLFVLIALANVYSNELLLWQSYATGHTEMEEVSGAIGGRAWRVSTAENPCALQSALEESLLTGQCIKGPLRSMCQFS